jgi:hypothetical protein
LFQKWLTFQNWHTYKLSRRVFIDSYLCSLTLSKRLILESKPVHIVAFKHGMATNFPLHMNLQLFLLLSKYRYLKITLTFNTAMPTCCCQFCGCSNTTTPWKLFTTVQWTQREYSLGNTWIGLPVCPFFWWKPKSDNLSRFEKYKHILTHGKNFIMEFTCIPEGWGMLLVLHYIEDYFDMAGKYFLGFFTFLV